MDRKLIALVSIALLAGLGGVYGLGYLIYQPQIQKFQNDLNTLNTKFDTVNSTLGSTQSSVTSLQNLLSVLESEISNLNSTIESMKNKTWHNVASFNLSADEWASSVFSIQGEQWRINWSEPLSFMSVSGWVGFLVCTPGGPAGPYVIDSVDIGPALTGPFLQARGTHYMYGIPGSYYIILRGIQNGWISFTIESYH